MNDVPDISDLQETIDRLRRTLIVTEKYLRHPDLQGIPFAVSASKAADRVARDIYAAEDVLRRCG